MKTVCIAFFLLFCPLALFAEDRSSSRFVKQGFEQLKASKYQTAIRTFNSATKIDPSCAEAYAGIGEAYLAMGNNDFSSNLELIEKSIDNLNIAIKLNPKMAAAHYKLATAYLVLNDKEKAVREYEILKRIDKNEASRLSVQISKNKTPNKYRFIGLSGPTRDSRTNYGAGNGTQPATPKAEQERFTGTVELFVTSWCPGCKRAIAYLKEKGIPYVAYDVESDAEAIKRFDELGGRGYPLILVGNNKFYGSDPKTIDYYIGR